MAAHRWLYTAALFAMGFVPTGIAAQDAPMPCLTAQHPGVHAPFDSVLRLLQPEEIALTGLVRDEDTGAPVPGVFVSVEGTDRIVASGADGRYLIRRLDRASVRSPTMVRASASGYQLELREVMLIGAGEGTFVVIGGERVPAPGCAVRLDFLVRRRPRVF